MHLNLNNTAHGTVEWNMNDRWVAWRWIVERWKFFWDWDGITVVGGCESFILWNENGLHVH